MDTYEKLIAWGLQMSLRYEKYLQKIPKLGKVDDDTGVKVAQYIDMPGINPQDTFSDQSRTRPDFLLSVVPDSEEDVQIWKTYCPGVFLAIVDYGFYNAYTDDFSYAPTYMAVKIMCHNRYKKSDLSGYTGFCVDDSYVHKAALYFGAKGHCVMDPWSELIAVQYALQYTDRLERAIKRRIGMAYDAPEIWEDKEAEIALQDKELSGWSMTWSTPWNSDYYRKARESSTEFHREQNLYNVK